MLSTSSPYITPDRPLTDIRRAVFARRFKMTPAVADVLAALAFGDRDGMADALRIVPISMEVR